MGMDVRAKIWLGIKTDEYIDFDEDPTRKENANNFFKELGNFEIEEVDCCEEILGYGIVLARHHWDNQVSELVLAKIQEMETKKPQIQQALSLMGIKGEVKLWLSADYS